MALNFLLLKEFHKPRTFGKSKGLQFNYILYDYLSTKNKVLSIKYNIFSILFHKKYSSDYEQQHLQMQWHN